MTDRLHPDLYAALVASHGNRVPDESEVSFRAGWYSLVDRMLADIACEYPDVRVLGITGCGWLHVDFSLPSGGDHDWTRHLDFDRWLQRYITESTWTCERCGSGHGRDRGNRFAVTCDECEKESCHA